jgi:hypothetical protein
LRPAVRPRRAGGGGQHGRLLVVLMALEEFERLKALEEITQSLRKKGKG